MVLLALLGLAAAWQWGALRDFLDARTLERWRTAFKGSPLAPIIVMGVYLIGGFLMAPISPLILATLLAFGPLLGSIYALVCSLVSASSTYGIGRLLGQDIVRRIAGRRLDRLQHLAARHGLTAMAVVRVLPLAPFSVVNLVAGAVQIAFRHFLLGSVIGLTPGILALTLFEQQFEALLRRPSISNFAVFVGALVLIVVALLALRRWSARGHS